MAFPRSASPSIWHTQHDRRTSAAMRPLRRANCNRAIRVRALALLAIGWLACGLPSSLLAQIPLGDVRVNLEPVASGFTSPVMATHAGDGSGRLFVVDQTGEIRVIDGGALLPEPFLDLSSEIVSVNSGFDERGVLGLAFHPEYESNGRFFVRYSAPRVGAAGEPCFGSSRGCHAEVLAEFSVSANPNVANPVGNILFAVDEPQFNHNAGEVAFGPDDFLYFTLGDGGGAHDGLADSPVSHGPIGNGQNIETTLGSVLRIDVNSGAPFAIPPDNPFVGAPGADEIYAYGLRNPYRFSFDDGPGGDGRLFLADVGQNRFEEIDIIEKGGNYGWVSREGAHFFDPNNPGTPPLTGPTTGPNGEPLIDPIVEYDHNEGTAVIGGFVYRGPTVENLEGKYVFGDYSNGFSNGRLFYVDVDEDLNQMFELQLGVDNEPLGKFLLGFGEDENGEIYVLTSGSGGPSGLTGEIFRIVPNRTTIQQPAAIYVTSDNDSAGALDDLGDVAVDVTANNRSQVGEIDSSTSNKINRLVAKFALPDAPAAAPFLESATLRFFLQDIAGTPDGPLSLLHSIMDNDLDLVPSDYENPSYVDTLLDLIQPTDPGGQYYELDVTELVLADLAADGLDPLSAFRLEISEAIFLDDGQSNRYRLRMPGLGVTPPQLLLTFTAVPEPSSIVLAILALVVVLAHSHRRRRA